MSRVPEPRLRVVIVSSIFPPDIGGPATHAHEVARGLRHRGQRPTVLTLADAPLIVRRRGTIVCIPRRWPWVVRAVAVMLWCLANRRSIDVVYATGLQTETVAGARLARLPVVVKIVGDPAWERGRRWGLTDEEFDEFQLDRLRDWRIQIMRRVRDWTVSAASRVVVPSEYLAAVVRRWCEEGRPIDVITNGVDLARIPRRRGGPAGSPLRALYVGRLVSHKQVEILIEAVAHTPDVQLTVAGDGPEREALERRSRELHVADRVCFLGPISHDQVLEELSNSHVLVTAASYEGLPHTAVEALACGTPPIASAAGGTAEAVEHCRTGIIVDPSTPQTFSAALGRIRDDRSELERLSREASIEGRRWGVESRIDELLRILTDIASCPVTSRRWGLRRGS